ncbi:DUF732 domain-containing protein [Mycobacterium terramassiliense]|uniref:DUF732 domain-containing protein n=1 Tax=Mycobacterium terramassiliense TaxID=1841859 RepID=A0A2U3NJD3_9MYCO|nr:DUF732 domain-containing protein [Mycobacterium terramassiliense]SPM31606.1 hypothetical protein MTAB308_5126 [Mycobacterium terramassiliense]
MFIGTTGRSGALVTAIVLLSGVAILRGGAAAADPQDDRFLALLDQEGIPALQGVPNLIDTAHDVCRTLDAGMPAAGLVDAMVNNAFGIDPAEREYAPGRLARTEARFITAAVGAYCPYDQGKIASIRANRTGWNGTTRSDARQARLTSLTAAVPSGEITDPDPTQIPATPPPAAQIRTPRQPVAAPPPPKQPPPPAQKPPPPPQQVAEPPPQEPPPPAVGPQPGGAAGGGGGASGGGGGTGGGNAGGTGGTGPRDPSPGFVRLAP